MHEPSPENDLAEARSKLRSARRAADSFENFSQERVSRIITAVAKAARDNAARFAEDAVRETGFGLVADKTTKNTAIVDLFLETHGSKNFCDPRFELDNKVIRIPRPAGVVFALTPSTSPAAALYFKVLSALITRSSILISPHPAAVAVSIAAAHVLSDAATAAGAPPDAVQILERPSVPLVNAIMADDLTKVILATGGSAMVRSAYQSGTPALGVGPGNPPVIVDITADLPQAASDIVTSKSFDNSVLCTAESVLFVVQPAASALRRELELQNAYFCTAEETQRLRDHMYPNGKFNTSVVGTGAFDIAKSARVHVPENTRLLVTPIDRIVDDEPLTHEKLSPVLAWHRVTDIPEAIRCAQALLKIVGIGHSAVIHSKDPSTVLRASAALPAHRISVNCPGSLGNAGIGTTLAPTMSVGTGFVGGSSSGDNLEPDHLVQWTKVAYASDPSVLFPDFTDAARDLARDEASEPAQQPRTTIADLGISRNELRQLVLEELRSLMEPSR